MCVCVCVCAHITKERRRHGERQEIPVLESQAMAITKMPGKGKWNICNCGHLLYIQVNREKQGAQAHGWTHYITHIASGIRGVVQQEKILRWKQITSQFCCIWVCLGSFGSYLKATLEGNAERTCILHLMPSWGCSAVFIQHPWAPIPGAWEVLKENIESLSPKSQNFEKYLFPDISLDFLLFLQY